MRTGVEKLLDLVKRLPPNERQEFALRFAQWQVDAASEDELIDTAREKLPVAEQKRLKRLVVKGEGAQLTDDERGDYVQLARQAEQLDARRLQALAELSRRWQLPVDAVMKRVGWERARHGA
jgi:hypothetical protein